MPRRELGAPDENRKKATRLFEQADGVNDTSDDCEEGIEEPVKRKSKKTEKSAEGYALKLLSMKTYTERALREKLKIKGYGCDETDEAVEKMRSFGYINDARLAQNAAEKLAARLYGRRKIFAYLASKGISGEIVEGLDLSEIDFKENCRTLALKYQAKGAQYEKIVAALSRAGFSSSEIYYAMAGTRLQAEN